jgi:hypothetical protein
LSAAVRVLPTDPSYLRELARLLTVDAESRQRVDPDALERSERTPVKAVPDTVVSVEGGG